jgi:hypothetical protein
MFNQSHAVLLATSLLYVVGTVACRANLGDTEAQCISRYGPEADTQDDVGYRQAGDKAVTFHPTMGKITYDVRVVFLHGQSCHETLSNSDSGAGLTEIQMKAILDSQSARLEWSKGKRTFHTNGVDSGTTTGRQDWLRSDGATATFWLSSQATAQTTTGEVEVSTREYTALQKYYDKQNGDGQ